MSETNGKIWEPRFGVPNGGVRPDGATPPRLARWRSALEKAIARFDSWQNDVTGFGTTRDKTTYGYQLPNRLLTYQELADLYHHDDMAARMVDVVPQEMLREPFDVETGNVNLDAIVADKIEALHVRERFADGMRWGRAFGGGACLVGADDGRDAREELRPGRAFDIEYLYDVDGRYIFPISYYDEPGDPKLGQPKTYMVTTIGGFSMSTMEVHESRLIVFYGAHTAHREKLLNRGWSFSVLQRAFAILRQFNSGWTAVENMMVDGSQSVFKIGGLADMLGAQGEDVLQARMRALDFYRSTVRAIVIDADAKEEFGRESTSFEQIPQVLDKFMLRLAATVEIPVTILMGQSPAGMNATGDSDFRWFYDRIRAQQTTHLAPRVRRLVDIWLQTKTGRAALEKFNKGDPPETIGVKFPPLWTETPSAQATRELQVAQKDQIYLQNQVFTPEEIALVRGRPDGFSTQLQLSDEQLEMREEMASVSAASALANANGEGASDDESDDSSTPSKDVAETVALELTPSDLAAITKVNEARKRYGLSPLSGADGNLTLPAFKAKYSQTIAEAANAEAGQPDGQPEEKPAPILHPGFGGAPPGANAAPPTKDGEKPPEELGRPSSEPKPGEKPNAPPPNAKSKPDDETKPKPDDEERTDSILRTLAPRFDAGPATFRMIRDEDESGVSGTGEIAHGVLFEDGKVALRWRTKTASTTLFDRIEDAIAVHGHGGKTRVVWDDPETEKRWSARAKAPKRRPKKK